MPAPVSLPAAADINQATLDAILNLAAAGPPTKPAPQPPLAAPKTPTAKKCAGPGEIRVTIWDEARGVKITGADAPTEDRLAAYLAAHPRCAVWSGQVAAPKPLPSSGLDRICDAAFEKPLKPIKQPTDAPTPAPAADEGVKRNQFPAEVVARLTAEFEKNSLPTKEVREALAAELDLAGRTVQVWFQNRRQRIKLAAPKPTDALSELVKIAEQEHGADPASPTSAIDSLAMVSSLANKSRKIGASTSPKTGATTDATTPHPSGFQWHVLDASQTAKPTTKDSNAPPQQQKPARPERTVAQHEALLAQYATDKFPSAATRERLASQLNMSAKSVQIWFQNKRARDPTREHQRTTAEPPPPVRISMADALPLVREEPSPPTAATAAAAATTAPNVFMAQLVMPPAAGAAPKHLQPRPPLQSKNISSTALSKGGRPAQAAGLMWRPISSFPTMRRAAAAAAATPAMRPAQSLAPKRPAPAAAEAPLAGMLMLLSEEGAKRQKLAAA